MILILGLATVLHFATYDGTSQMTKCSPCTSKHRTNSLQVRELVVVGSIVLLATDARIRRNWGAAIGCLVSTQPISLILTEPAITFDELHPFPHRV